MDYKSKVGQLWLKKFKNSEPEGQYKLLDVMQDEYPVAPAREQQSKPLKPESAIDSERRKEMEELKKEYKKRIRERTA